MKKSKRLEKYEQASFLDTSFEVSAKYTPKHKQYYEQYCIGKNFEPALAPLPPTTSLLVYSHPLITPDEGRSDFTLLRNLYERFNKQLEYKQRQSTGIYRGAIFAVGNLLDFPQSNCIKSFEDHFNAYVRAIPSHERIYTCSLFSQSDILPLEVQEIEDAFASQAPSIALSSMLNVSLTKCIRGRKQFYIAPHHYFQRYQISPQPFPTPIFVDLLHPSGPHNPSIHLGNKESKSSQQEQIEQYITNYFIPTMYKDSKLPSVLCVHSPIPKYVQYEITRDSVQYCIHTLFTGKIRANQDNTSDNYDPYESIWTASLSYDKYEVNNFACYEHPLEDISGSNKSSPQKAYPRKICISL